MEKMYFKFEIDGYRIASLDELIFTDNEKLWPKISIDQFSVLSFILPGQSYHFLYHSGTFLIPFNEGDDFISFLVERGANRIKYDLNEIITKDNHITGFVSTDGTTYDVNYLWMTEGYQYQILVKGEKEADVMLVVSAGAKLIVNPDKSPIKINLVFKGDKSNPDIQKALEELSENKTSGCLFGVIAMVVLLVAFYYLGELFNWVQGLFS